MSHTVTHKLRLSSNLVAQQRSHIKLGVAMRSSYVRGSYTGSYETRTSRDTDVYRSGYSSASSTYKSYRSTEPTRDRDVKDKEEETADHSEEDYTTLRSKLRTLQREVSNSANLLETTSREKQELSVQLTHAKRDKAKVAAEAEAIEVERDTLERENRRIKSKLDSAAKELRELNEERRELSEKLRASDGTSLFSPHLRTSKAGKGSFSIFRAAVLFFHSTHPIARHLFFHDWHAGADASPKKRPGCPSPHYIFSPRFHSSAVLTLHLLSSRHLALCIHSTHHRAHYCF